MTMMKIVMCDRIDNDDMNKHSGLVAGNIVYDYYHACKRKKYANPLAICNMIL